MDNLRTIPRGKVGLCAAILAGLWLAVEPAYSQNETGVWRPVRTDAYGNAMSWHPERRSVGSFSSEVQLQAVRGSQLAGRGRNRRGAGTYFSLPGHRRTAGRLNLLSRPPQFRAESPAARTGFRYYGGFGPRPGAPQTADPAVIFSRRYLLVEATARNAPVRRAYLDRGPFAAVPMSVDDVPATPGGESEPASSGATTLDDHLRRRVGDAHLRTRSNGWTWFTEGKYRQAARAFESAAALEPADFESRIGELISYVSAGAMRTSMVLLDQLCRRDPNPFAHQLRIGEYYEDPVEARQVIIRSQLFARSGSRGAGASALNAFVLWYVGEWEEAQSAAAHLARDHGDSPYAHWPTLMEAARRSTDDE